MPTENASARLAKIEQWAKLHCRMPKPTADDTLCEYCQRTSTKYLLEAVAIARELEAAKARLEREVEQLRDPSCGVCEKALALARRGEGE